MPGQGRLGDKGNVQADAHGCPACPHPAVGPAIAGSPDVMVNKRPALRVDDPGIHAACCGPNTWTATQGAPSVFINGKAAHRLNDAQRHCGGIGKLIEASTNVMVGDTSGGGGGGGGGAAGGAGAGAAGGGAGGAGGGAAGGGAGGAGSSGTSGSSGSGGSSGSSTNGSSPGQPGFQTPPVDVPNTPIEPDQIEIRVVTPTGEAVDGIAYELTMPDGSVRTGTADVTGVILLTGLTQRGDCKLRFPKIDDERSEQPKP